MDGLDQQLTVVVGLSIECQYMIQALHVVKAHLVELLLGCPLKLLLQEKYHLLNIPARGHGKYDIDRLSPHFHVGCPNNELSTYIYPTDE
jgi:hypothetical protein